MNIEWNKVTWYSKITAVILFVGTFFLGFWLGTMKVEKVYIDIPHVIHRSETSPIKTAKSTSILVTKSSAASANEATCNESPKYFVVEENHTGDVGTDHLIKYKTTESQHFECKYVVEKTDFEIKNEWADYFLALENNFLILDSGTGPATRGLIVYDLTKRANVFSDTYSRPIIVKDSTIDYWAETQEKATQANCPELATYEGGGLGAAIDTHVILNLSTLTKKELGEKRCDARQ